MGSSFFISSACVSNLYIFYYLIEHKTLYLNEFDIPVARLKRYIGNIRFMLIEYQLYHLDIVYDYATNSYNLIGDI